MINLQRSQSIPPSLTKNPQLDDAYRQKDVRDQLRTDFLNKCYLCESIFNRDLTVDHREPKSVNQARINDWTNLYASCSKCNQRRGNNYPSGGLLFNADGDDVEMSIEYATVDGDKFDDITCVFATASTDQKVINTAAELDELHNASSTTSVAHKADARELRKTIMGEIVKLLRLIQSYWVTLNSGTVLEKQKIEVKLRKTLSRKSRFSMILRIEVGNNPMITQFFD